MSNDTNTVLQCSHCGDTCPNDSLRIEEEVFCCIGCQNVYQLLQSNDLGDYYAFEKNPGKKAMQQGVADYTFLDNESIQQSLELFADGHIAKVSLHLPNIHCSSCLWLLEHLSQLDKGILHSNVNFGSKKATITYDKSLISLKELASWLDRIGYPPNINFGDLDKGDRQNDVDRSAMYKLGLAGFAFGNIMLLSFPEYLGFERASHHFYLGYFSMILAIPVLLYSGRDYIVSAWKGLRMRLLNIDVPIAIGMLSLFGRSCYEILGGVGEGYFDSFAGFVFFLLIGKWFQSYTYASLDFERSYTSYFPISVLIQDDKSWVSTPISVLTTCDTIRVRNGEIIPADGHIISGQGRIDYSFVTGESDHISKSAGDKVYAGGRQVGDYIEVQVTKAVDQSYLTSLWNKENFAQGKTPTTNIIDHISKYFTVVILIMAITSGTYWYITAGMAMSINVFTSVLIVACPCALALAIPFTYGNVLRLCAKDGLFIKNVSAINELGGIDTIVFDKTGTITDSQKLKMTYIGKSLDAAVIASIKSVAIRSTHPLSQAIAQNYEGVEEVGVSNFEEIVGKGIQGTTEMHAIRMGSGDFIFGGDTSESTVVLLEVDGIYMGRFVADHALRSNIAEVLYKLGGDYDLAVLTGDSDRALDTIKGIFAEPRHIYHSQSPQDKMDKISAWQYDGHKVMMVGDGLNDAGALKQADFGVVLSDQVNNFSPACDGILDANKLSYLPAFISKIRATRWVIYLTIFFAIVYNLVGLSYAIWGQLTPVIAAILMPLSSVTIVLIGVIGSTLVMRR